MLDECKIELIQSTTPLLERFGDQINEVFFERLFEKSTFLENIAKSSNMAEEDIFTVSDALVKFSINIENIEVLTPTIHRIVRNFKSLDLQAEHFELVGESLLFALQKILGLRDGHSALKAWGSAYEVLMEVCNHSDKTLNVTTTQKKIFA